MFPDLHWISLGNEGTDWLNAELKDLSRLGRWIQDGQGQMKLDLEWQIDLAASFVRQDRIKEGDVFAAAPAVLSVAAVEDLSDENDPRVLSASMERFQFGIDETSDEAASRFCIVPSSVHPASDPWIDRLRRTIPSSAKLVFSNEAVYGLFSFPKISVEGAEQLDTTLTELAFSPPTLAFSGGNRFDEICEAIWMTDMITDDQIRDLSGSTTRILAKVGTGGAFVLWQASQN